MTETSRADIAWRRISEGKSSKKEEKTEAGERGSSVWEKIVTRFRENYCPDRSPPLILPSAPTDGEKYSYLDMNRKFLLTCASLALLALTVGSWMFAKASPIFCWFAVYIFLSQLYLYVSLFITFLGKKFDLASHKSVLTDNPLTAAEDAPSVDIYLPVCKEPREILENTWEHVAALDYPATQLSVYVLDDGVSEDVKSLAARFGFTYICRPNRPELKKAGNIRYAFTQTSGAFYVVFDADFCPRADFLTETVPYMKADSRLALLQTPQFFRSLPTQTWTEQGAGACQEYIFRVLQPCRDRYGASMCVGSNAIYRRAAFESVGGSIGVDCSEDLYTGFWAATHGWSVKYMPLVLACGVCPDVPRAFFAQQVRWCTGSMTLHLSREFWSSSLSAKQKVCYLIGFMYNIFSAVNIFLAPLPAPLILWTKPELFKYYNLFFAFPTLLMGLVALRIWTKGRYTFAVQYAETVMTYAYLQSILDYIRGKHLAWMPSRREGKVHGNKRYTNMRILAWIWTITHQAALIAACVYRVVGGMPWYHLVPALVIDVYFLLCLHRFLLYKHAKKA